VATTKKKKVLNKKKFHQVGKDGCRLKKLKIKKFKDCQNGDSIFIIKTFCTDAII
jgi:hypothetical protein